MATITMRVKVEDTAAGPVMIMLRKTPGVIGFDFDEQSFPGTPPAPKAPGKTIGSQALELFVQANGEPVTIDQVARTLGGTRGRAHGALNGLSEQKLIRRIAKGTWALTAKGRAALGLPAQKLLPAPAKKSKPAKVAKAKPAKQAKSNGHAKPPSTRGVTTNALRDMLTKRGPMLPREIGATFPDYGISAGALHGAIDRGKKKGLVRKLADGRIELTAKSEG